MKFVIEFQKFPKDSNCCEFIINDHVYNGLLIFRDFLDKRKQPIIDTTRLDLVLLHLVFCITDVYIDDKLNSIITILSIISCNLPVLPGLHDQEHQKAGIGQISDRGTPRGQCSRWDRIISILLCLPRE